MRTASLIGVLGSPSAVAAFFGITKSAVSQWGEFVPPLRVYEARELRPSIDAELATHEEKQRLAAASAIGNTA
jgi:DNA-binding transcriptional regulator YdaS (Cro superfamily)